MFHHLSILRTRVQYAFVYAFCLLVVYCSPTSSQAQLAGDHFQHVWPQSTVAAFEDIQYVNDSIWIAYGMANDIYRSDDSGNTWRKLVIFTTATIECVHFVDPLIGFAGDARGRIFQSVDGGKDWQIVYQDTSLRMAQFFAIDAENIYAMTDYRYVLHTTNQGKSWKRYDTQHTAGEFKYMHFHSDQMGYIVANGALLKTENGGVNWTMVNDSTTPSLQNTNRVTNAAYFWNAQKMYIWRYSGLGFNYTEDGGKRWQSRQISLIDSAGALFDTSIYSRYGHPYIWRMAFVDSLFGIFQLLGQSSRNNWLAYTTNGGRTLHEIPGSRSWLFSMFKANPASRSFVLQDDYDNLFTIGTDLKLQPMRPTNYKQFSQIVSIDSNHFVLKALNRSGNIHELTHVIDTQTTMVTLPWLIGSEALSEPIMQMVNHSVGYSLGSVNHLLNYSYHLLVRTTDGGRTWETPLSLREKPEMGTWICSYKPLSEDSVLILTQDSASRKHRLWRSIDGGRNWTLLFDAFDEFTVIRATQEAQKHLPKERLIYKMDFWNANDGIIYLEGFDILRTNDGGYNWGYQMIAADDGTNIRAFAGSENSSVQLGNNGSGLVFWRRGSGDLAPMVFATSNYGNTWNSLVMGGFDTRIIRMATNDVAFQLSGKYFTPIYQSNDGFKSWYPYYILQATPPVIDMSFYSSTGGFALDIGRNVYRIRFPLTYREPIVLNPNNYPDPNAGTIYPNPTEGALFFHIMNPEPTQLRLYDVNGKKLVDNHFTEMGQVSIDLSPFPSGVYLLEIHNQGQKKTHKVVRY